MAKRPGPVRRWLAALGAALVSLLARLLVRTLRVTFVGPSPATLPHPCVYAFAHGRQVPLLRWPRPRTAVLASLSRDGRLQARVMRRFGFEVLDGSSSRGGARALAGALERLRGGLDLALAVDGPRGPRGVVKPGVVYLASRSGVFLIPMSSACVRAWRLQTWDGFALPWPFSRVVVVVGRPMAVPEDVPVEQLEGVRRELERELGRLALVAEARAESLTDRSVNKGKS
ncbi:MAG: lysophospholipid acyltransferase family protein [Deltaproteobacteria bacterium]|nr:lysophospholipid acyltransferase family protein [Deltaproteobacteria bacterium]